MTVRRLLCLFLLCSSAAMSQSQPQIAAIFSDLKPDAPGCAALVVNHGQTVFKQGFGVTNLDQPTPLIPSTNFRLASVTKQFTAAAIMLLVRDGKLKYDDRLTDIF